MDSPPKRRPHPSSRRAAMLALLSLAIAGVIAAPSATAETLPQDRLAANPLAPLLAPVPSRPISPAVPSGPPSGAFGLATPLDLHAAPVPYAPPLPTPDLSGAPSQPLVRLSAASRTSSDVIGPSYGVADVYGAAGGTDIGPAHPEAFAQYSSECWFQSITVQGYNGSGCAGPHRGQMSFVRLRVPYDAVGTYDSASGQCTYSAALLEGGVTFAGLTDHAAQDWDYLYTRLLEARADGLVPLVDIENGTTITDTAINGPANPQPMAPLTATSPTDRSHLSELDDYTCGVYLLMWATAAAGVPVSYWEAWNEPNYQCAVYSTAGGPCPSLPYVSPLGTGTGTGTWNAAFLWHAANEAGKLITARYGVPEYVAALTVGQAQNLGYSNPYIANIKGIAHCSRGFQPAWGCQGPSDTPRYWAIHDYDDPSWGRWHQATIAGDLQTIETDLAQAEGLDHRAAIQVWVTESGTHLEDKTSHDANGTSHCDDGDHTTTGTLGACVDRQPGSQYVGAEIWHALGQVYAHDLNSVATTMVLWYEYALPVERSPWDSALADTVPAKRDPPPYLETGRASYCAVFGMPVSACLSDGSHPADYRYAS